VRRLLVTASVVPSSPILVTLMKKVLSSYETSVLTRGALHNITEDGIRHSHRRENLNLTFFSLFTKAYQSHLHYGSRHFPSCYTVTAITMAFPLPLVLDRRR
jgi:hypothetical protein